MPEKKAAATKKVTTGKSVAASKASKTAPAKKVAKGQSYACQVCGLVVTVDETCGCTDVCDIICCNKPMKARKVPVKAKASK